MLRRLHLKVLLLGNSGVGKSALMNQYVNNRFSNLYRATIGADFLSKELRVDGRAITVQIWDTAGTERFQSLGTALYRGCDCCLLVFDVTSAGSFRALKTWHEEFRVQALPKAGGVVVVIGNKADLSERQVAPQEAQEWSAAHDAPYFETSAKEATNVQEAFTWAIHALLKTQKEPELLQPEAVQLGEERPPQKNCSC